MTAEIHPVLGPLESHWSSEFCGSDFQSFQSRTGVSGLAKVSGNRLEILAVHATHRGRGEFRNFMRECKANFRSIRFWALMNATMEVILSKYGFIGGHDIDEHGEMCDCWDWSAVNK